MNIRTATKEDAPAISEQLFLAMEDILYEFIGVKNQEKAKACLGYFVKRENNLYSFQNCLVAEKDDEILGSINLYDGAKSDLLRAPVLQHIRTHFNENFNPEKETQPGEYYIDSFGVSIPQQGKGIGTELLQFVINKYTLEQQQTLGLLVDEDNPAAKKLYLKLGFKPVGRKTLVGKMMVHLQIKSIKPTTANPNN
ncbi:MAG: GNAT family N-acetyltransferase [Bacteroidetes bacterium]|nr:MAG: GNAT family N-acetyltransferase [Bacteroidota bacterium]PTM11784.1 MAG: GNAT family N-acetyltransferase [Bacteroidota bacterium]